MKPENAPHLDEWMNASEIAVFLGVSRTTVNEMIRAGEFKTLHTSGPVGARPAYMVKRDEVEALANVRTFPRAKAEDSAEVG